MRENPNAERFWLASFGCKKVYTFFGASFGEEYAKYVETIPAKKTGFTFGTI